MRDVLSGGKRKPMEKTGTKVLTASEVRKLPCGSKVIRRNRNRDEVYEVVMRGRYKKLFRHDKWHGAMYWIPISDTDTYILWRRQS